MIESPSLQIRTVSIREALHEAAEHYHAGRYDEARTICAQLLAQRPNNAHALHLLGVIEIKRNNHTAALPFFEQAVALQDNNAELHSNFGSVLSELKRPDEALHHLRRALALKRDYPEAHLNLAMVLMENGDFAGALTEFQQTLALNPDLHDAHIGQGCAENQLLLIPEAIASFRRAILANPDNVAAHLNLAMMLLCAGAFAEGWREYEWRVRSHLWGSRTFQQPRWQGEPVRGRTVLVACEQGLGDTVQFVRYLPALKKLGAKVVLECRAELKTLLDKHPAIDLLIDWPRASDVSGGVDCYVPLMSLPLHLEIGLQYVPEAMPYLHADPSDAVSWRQRIAQPGLKVGLVWSGNPENAKDRYRSLSLRDFAGLADIPGIAFFSLQKGAAAAQTAKPPAGMTLVDLSEYLTDFRQTAAAIMQLDLVVSVDTSVAHLAGALGKAVWTLLPYSPDWRWMLERDDTHWYPTMRLFRQRRFGEWQDVVGRVVDSLRSLRPEAAAVPAFHPALPLDAAFEHCRNGRFRDAEQVCRQILHGQPNHFDALRLLGEVLIQENRHGDAIEVFQRALKLRPGEAIVHFNLAVVLAKVGRRGEAISSYQRATAVAPQNPEIHFNLANALRDQERSQEAIDHYRQALAARPGYVKARVNLGNLLRRLGQTEEAIAQFQAALEINQDHAKANLGLGLSLLDRGDAEQAMPHLEKATAADPTASEVHNGLGAALLELGRLGESQACFKRALALRPMYVEAVGSLAATYARLGQFDAGREAFQRAIELPRSPQANCHLARLAMSEFGWIDQAVQLVRESLRTKPDWPEAHYDLGSLLLYQGKLREGYAEHEWRHRLPDGGARPNVAQPVWEGSHLYGRTILLYGEQGCGDVIQMARFVPLVVERGGRVIIGCSQPLVSLLSGMPGVVAASDRGETMPAFDVVAPLLSLPHLLGITLETLPAAIPYLRAPDERVVPLPPTGTNKLRVGIAWAGNSRFKNNRRRSCGFSYFRDLIDRHPDVAFFSMQVGERSQSAEDSEAPSALVDLSSLLTDWAATASILSQLNLVISVDTGIVHLAGALGKPVWTLLASSADPRWLLNRSDSPWYPTMRLFRQQRPGDWQGVFQHIDGALAAWGGDPVPLITTS